jgi:hypothetical protein
MKNRVFRMSSGRSIAVACVAAFLGLTTVAVVPTQANTMFNLTPVDLGGGFSFFGTLTTDGTVGNLTGANITDWNITFRSVTDYVFDKQNTVNYSVGVSSDGASLTVPTSPDGIDDGGSLFFRSPNPFADVGAQVADFTQSSGNGGQAMYMYGGAFDFTALNQPHGIDYQAATLRSGSSTLFDLVPVTFAGGTKMTGTILTDGSVGSAVIEDWNILVRETFQWNFDPANSSVVDDFNLASDGQFLTVTPFDVDGNPGAFSIGRPGFEPTLVKLADFTYFPDGEAGIISPIIYQTAGPLGLDQNGNYRVATAAVPDSSPGVLVPALMIGLCCADYFRRRKGIPPALA